MTASIEGWTQIEIAGRSADVFQPSGGELYEAAVIFLHGRALDTLAGDVVFTEQLARHGLPCVCPHGGRCWWLDTISPDFDEAVTPLAWVRNTLTDWISHTWNLSPPAIGLLGVSMGGQGALQLAYRHARQFPVVAAISPAVDFQNMWGQGWELDEMFANAEAARQQSVTLHLHPLNWPLHQLIVCDPADAIWHEGCERLASKLTSMGIPFERDLTTSAGGHCWEYFRTMALRCVEHLAHGLRSVREKERRT